MVYLRDEKEIRGIRAAAEVVAETLRLLEREVAPGVTTAHLDRVAEAFIRSRGARPACCSGPDKIRPLHLTDRIAAPGREEVA